MAKKNRGKVKCRNQISQIKSKVLISRLHHDLKIYLPIDKYMYMLKYT